MTYISIKKYSNPSYYEYNADNLPLVAVDDQTNLPYYNKNLDGTEIYPLGPIILNNIYAKDKNLLPYYPTGDDGKEVYMKNDDIKKIYIFHGQSPVFAKNTEKKPFYATDSENLEFYPTFNGKEIFLTINDKQIYVKKNNEEIYPRHFDITDLKYNSFDEIYALNGEIPYYATDFDNSEYYAERYGFMKYLIIDGKEIYARDFNNSEIYSFDPLRNQNYAKNKEGLSYYARDFNNSEIYAFNRSGVPQYLKNKDGIPYYARDFNNSEIYAFDQSGEPHFIKGRYAKLKNNLEYYPVYFNGDDVYMYDSLRELYIRNENGKEIYARIRGKEEYAYDFVEDIQLYANDEHHNQYYATMHDGKPYFAKSYFNDRPYYAINSQGKEFYFEIAKDENLKPIHPNSGYVSFNCKNPIIITYMDFLKYTKRSHIWFRILIFLFFIIIIFVILVLLVRKKG